MENIKYRVVGYTATEQKYVDHESRIMSFKSAKKLIQSNLDNIKYYRFDLVKVVEEELIVLDIIYGFHTKEEVEKEYNSALSTECYFINGYTATGTCRLCIDEKKLTETNAEEWVSKLWNDITYYRFDIVKVVDGKESVYKTIPARHTKAEVEKSYFKVYYKIYGRNGSMMLEEIKIKEEILSIEQAQAIIQQMSGNRKYFQYEIMKKSPDGDELLGKEFKINSDYTFDEVRAHYLEEKTKKESQDCLQSETVSKNENSDFFQQQNIINFRESKEELQKKTVTRLEHINPKPGECLKLQDAGKNNKFCSTRRGEKNRQKAKQKYLAMGGRR